MKIQNEQLNRLSWLIFFCFFIVLITNLGLFTAKGMTTRSIPFSLKEGEVTNLKDSSYKELFKNKIVTAIDSFKTFSMEPDEEREIERPGFNISVGEDVEEVGIFGNILYPQIIEGRKTVEITLQDTISNEIFNANIDTVEIIDLIKLFEILLYLFLMIFSLFNSYILIRYSQDKENLLVVLFLLLLFTPKATTLLNPFLLGIWSEVISPFWGVIFYHFILLKTKISKNIRKIYIISFIIFIAQYFAKLVGIPISLQHLWAVIWLIKGFLLLRKQYKRNKEIGLKRLLAAFGGIGFSLMSILVFVILIALILLTAGIGSIAGLTDLFDDYEILGIVIGILALLPIVGFVIGVLWFFGSFSWSLLTGTVMDVKIRSTLIYSLVGFIFIIMFGLIDYSLGEILQSQFGKFLGSEFIAGIPATIGLLLFFNPVRNYAEKMVDRKLNSSELDFLEKTETFTRNISEDGIIEGFEEYICDNLITILPIKKIAIISFDHNLNDFKFNEIRGSNIVENSITSDKNKLLNRGELVKNQDQDQNEQDVASFELIIPIIFENEQKWFLAFGKKLDRSSYIKKDLIALKGLVERIKLSLKFILTYEDLTREKFTRLLNKKELMIKKKDEEIKKLKELIESNGIELKDN